MLNLLKNSISLCFAVAIFFACGHQGFAQRVAVVVPNEIDKLANEFSRHLQNELEKKFRVIDIEIAAASYASLKFDEPFNMNIESAKRIGTLIGCDHFILVRSNTSRRSSSSRPSYFETSTFLWLVNTRTGLLGKWIYAAKQAQTAAEAERAMVSDAASTVKELENALNSISKQGSVDVNFPVFDDANKSLRPAMPYKRIKPVYSNTAYLFDVKATVEAEVSIDEKGVVKRIDIVRWAGFGLDEAVVTAITSMNWRPGERDGKPLPMRILLRYNFTKIEKE